MNGEPVVSDAFGLAVTDMYRGHAAPIFIERDDGLIEEDSVPYLDCRVPVDTWAIEKAGDRVADLGCGAGRILAQLDEKGIEAVGFDESPGAISVCHERGFKSAVLAEIGEVADCLSDFDTAFLLGYMLPFAFEPRKGSVSIIETLSRAARPGMRLIGTGFDPEKIDDPLYVSYFEDNLRKGAAHGAIGIRVRYKTVASRWMMGEWMSLPVLESKMHEYGWELVDCFEALAYGAVLRFG